MFYPFKRLWRTTVYSWQGLQAACRYQWVFPLEILLLLVAIPVGIYAGKTAAEKVLLIASVFLILIVELINSALETIIDRISLDRHELSGRAKDLGSAAVFLTVLNAIIIWVIILLPKIG